jgi:DNA polymerase V
MSIPIPVTAEQISLNMAEAIVPAGFPSPCEDHAIKRIDLNEILLLRPDASFMFRVKGDSMTDAGIFDGDTLIVDRSITPAHNHIVVAIVDGDFTVKRLYMRAGRIRLMPANADFDPIDFKDGQELRVFGVATHNVHHLAAGPWQRE